MVSKQSLCSHLKTICCPGLPDCSGVNITLVTTVPGICLSSSIPWPFLVKVRLLLVETISMRAPVTIKERVLIFRELTTSGTVLSSIAFDLLEFSSPGQR